jgi:hypothetical protein
MVSKSCGNFIRAARDGWQRRVRDQIRIANEADRHRRNLKIQAPSDAISEVSRIA